MVGEESPDFIEHGARCKPGRGDPTESATESKPPPLGFWSLCFGSEQSFGLKSEDRMRTKVRAPLSRSSGGKGETVR